MMAVIKCELLFVCPLQQPTPQPTTEPKQVMIIIVLTTIIIMKIIIVLEACMLASCGRVSYWVGHENSFDHSIYITKGC